MYEACGLLFLFLEQPMHPGSGDSVAGVDLPVQRERHTGYPMVQASGVKGALRKAAQARPGSGDETVRLVNWLFGPDNAEAAGALVVTDARTLLFPVKSLRDVFGWVTCSHVLGRLAADLRAGWLAGAASVAGLLGHLDALSRLRLDGGDGEESALWAADSALPLPATGRVYLEERVLSVANGGTGRAELSTLLSRLAEAAMPDFWGGLLPRKAAVVPDTAFEHFVRFSTQIETHVKIGALGKVEQGPWDVEMIPAETLMYCLVGFEGGRGSGESAQEALKAFQKQVIPQSRHLQMAGDATLGRGIVWLSFAPVGDLLAAGATNPGSQRGGNR